MKTIKSIISLPAILLILLAFSACKKNTDDTVPKEETEITEDIDLTKYYIIGKIPTTVSGKTVQIPYIITFDEYGMAQLLNEQEKKFTYENGKLTIGYNLMVFKIKDKQIIQYEDPIKRYPYSSYSLKKIPEKNQFNGNIYEGYLANKTKTFTRLKFEPKTCVVTMEPRFSFNGDYTLIANVACKIRSYATYEENYTQCTFVLIDDKLEAFIAKPNLVDPQIENYTYGTLNKVN